MGANRLAGDSMGYGFVDFDEVADARVAIERLNGTLVRNKRIKVSYARKRDASAAVRRAHELQ